MSSLVFDVNRVAPWVCSRIGATYTGIGAGIGLERDGQLIGGVFYENFNGRSVLAHIAGESGWMTRRFLWAIFDYPFSQLRVNVILGTVDSHNLAARKLNEHLGFELKCEIPDAGDSGDMCLYTMTPSQCRWLHLKDRYGKEKRPASEPGLPRGS